MEIVRYLIEKQANNIVQYVAAPIIASSGSFLVYWLLKTLGYTFVKRDRELHRVQLNQFEEVKANQAEIRRQKIMQYLNENRDKDASEFLEVPEGYFVEATTLESKDAFYAQAARLRWQLKRNELLLLERVSDLMICFFAQNITTYAFPTIKLKNNQSWGWYVVIECDELSAKSIINEIERYKDWLGIGVLIIKRNPITYRKCRTAPMEGTLGGVLVNGKGESFGLTCAHAITENCCSLDYRISLRSAEIFQPDVALVKLGTGKNCFRMDSFKKNAVTIAQNVQEIQNLKTSVRKIFPSSPRLAGYIFAEVGSFSSW